MESKEKSILEIIIHNIKENPFSVVIILLSACVGAILGMAAYYNSRLG